MEFYRGYIGIMEKKMETSNPQAIAGQLSVEPAGCWSNAITRV